MKNYTPLLSLCLVLACAAFSACAAGADDDGCTSSAECDSGQVCISGECVRSSRPGGDTGNTNDTGGSLDVGIDTAVGDTGVVPDTGNDTGTGDDTGTTGCTTSSDCPVGQSCTNGTCAPNSTTCTVDSQCFTGACCVDGTCIVQQGGCGGSQGAACTLPQGEVFSDEGEYYCILLEGTTNSLLYKKCTEVFFDPACPANTYCSSASDGTNDIDFCAPAECTTTGATGTSQCGGDTCILLRNNTGTCFPAGNLSPGASCDTGATDAAGTCSANHFCQTDTQGTTTGTCRQFCDVWGSGGQCPGGQACDLFNSAQGICAPAIGGSNGDTCSSTGSLCTDGVGCFAFSDGDYCVDYCRRNAGDCSGFDEQCNWNIFLGTSEFGLCLPSQCLFDSDCTEPGETCHDDGVCAQLCSTAAGCAGTNYQCIDGVCKPPSN